MATDLRSTPRRRWRPSLIPLELLAATLHWAALWALALLVLSLIA
ncbi:hypothetical protein [Roseomonas rosulenta]|nr:hypothetical protein [Roseomonas rosulenta]